MATLKITLEIKVDERSASCNVEVPLTAIGAMTPGYHRASQKLVVDFVSAVVSKVLGAREFKMPDAPATTSSTKGGMNGYSAEHTTKTEYELGHDFDLLNHDA